MKALLLGLRFLGTSVVVAIERLRRAPARPSWTVGDEARARFLRAFWRKLDRRPFPDQRAIAESLPVLLPGALLRTRRARMQLGDVPATAITPRRGAEARVVLYFHGGAYVLGSARMLRDLLARLALSARARVIAPDYRLAPEHPYPAALDDALRAYRALLVEHPATHVVVAGDSAGGNLALSLLLTIRDAGERLPAGAVLLSPWVDLACERPSYLENAPYDFLDRARAGRAAAAFAGPLPVTDPRISPLHADLRGLPPLFIQGGSAELLKDELAELAERARTAGVQTVLELWEDQVHDFQAFGALSSRSLQALERMGDAIQVLTPTIQLRT